MSRSLIALAAVACLAGLTSCNKEDPAALYIDVAYQLRCIDCEPRGTDGPPRDVQAVNGEAGAKLTCYSENGRVTMELEGSGYSLRILQFRLGADPGEQCEVVVSEGSGSEYRGGCRAPGSDNDADAPCEVELNNEGGVITGTLLCNNITHANTPEYERYVVAPMSDDAVDITIQGCSGL